VPRRNPKSTFSPQRDPEIRKEEGRKKEKKKKEKEKRKKKKVSIKPQGHKKRSRANLALVEGPHDGMNGPGKDLGGNTRMFPRLGVCCHMGRGLIAQHNKLQPQV